MTDKMKMTDAGKAREVRKQGERFLASRACAYFPCHQGADPDDFNCLFCYCPLYPLGEQCGGKFRYAEAGSKDCSNCLLPHGCDGYDLVLKRFPDIAALAKRTESD